MRLQLSHRFKHCWQESHKYGRVCFVTRTANRFISPPAGRSSPMHSSWHDAFREHHRAVAELAERGVKVDYRTVWSFVHAERLSFKKNRRSQRAGPPGRRPSPQPIEGASAATRAEPFVPRSGLPAQGCSSCRPIAPISTQSNKSSPSSNICREKHPNEPSRHLDTHRPPAQRLHQRRMWSLSR